MQTFFVFKECKDLCISLGPSCIGSSWHTYGFCATATWGDVLITGSKSRHNPYFNIVEIVNGKPRKVKNVKRDFFRRQDAPKTYDMNASIYIWNRKTLLKSFTAALERSAKWKIIFYEMPEKRSIDIDNEFDFKLVEFLLKQKK